MYLRKIYMKIRVLLLSANPTNTSALRVDREFREIQIALEQTDQKKYFTVKTRTAVRESDFRTMLLDVKPHIVHFSGHGTEQGLYLEDESGVARLATNAGVAGLFRHISSIHCVILNACYTHELAIELKKYVPYIIGMKTAIADSVAPNKLYT